MRGMRILLMLFLAAGLPGCAIVQVSVRNPVVGLEKVAIAPFFNLSSERSVDGHDFAEAYYAELQKVPGFEVVPVGIAERAIRENQLTLDGPEDALRLARILDVDAVVIGAVTDYDPYVPRVGLKVSWYSHHDWEFLPSVPPSEQASKSKRRAFLPESIDLWSQVTRANCPPRKTTSGGQPVAITRGQSPSAESSRLTAISEAVPEGNWQAIGQHVATAPRTTKVTVDEDFLPPVHTSNAQAAESARPPSRPRQSEIQQTSGQDVSEFIPGPLFGEHRTRPLFERTPAPALFEEAEFVAFSDGESIVAPPHHFDQFAPQIVDMTGSDGRPVAVTYELSHVVMTPPLPLPPPPHPVVQPINATTTDSLPHSTDELMGQILPTSVPTPSQFRPTTSRAAVSNNNSDRSVSTTGTPAAAWPSDATGDVSSTQRLFDPRQPLMSYVRMFDATDAKLVARLSDYLELSGETRTGDVSAFMRRSDFFQKFTAHVMISEMLSLHGGEARRRWVLKSRQYR